MFLYIAYMKYICAPCSWFDLFMSFSWIYLALHLHVIFHKIHTSVWWRIFHNNMQLITTNSYILHIWSIYVLHAVGVIYSCLFDEYIWPFTFISFLIEWSTYKCSIYHETHYHMFLYITYMKYICAPCSWCDLFMFFVEYI